MKKLLSISILTSLLGFGVASASSAISFPDVDSTDWFYDDVMSMVDWGVIQGNDDGTFKPENNVNRAELSAMWNRYDERVQEIATGSVELDAYSKDEMDGVIAWIQAEINYLNGSQYLYLSSSAYQDNYLASQIGLSSDTCDVIELFQERAEEAMDNVEYYVDNYDLNVYPESSRDAIVEGIELYEDDCEDLW